MDKKDKDELTNIVNQMLRKREEYKRWYNKNKDKHRAKMKIYSSEHKKESRGYTLKKKYQLSLADYETLVTKQNGRCSICNNPPKEGKLLVVDHDHITNEIRGLLCFGCNTGLGYVERLEWLEKAFNYLKL